MKEEVEFLIPLIANGEMSKADIEVLMDKLRDAIKQDPSQGKELGHLLGLINSASKARTILPSIDLRSIGKGYLAIGHKPGGKISFQGMKTIGVSCVLTLLHENEGAIQIGDQVKKTGMEWIWFPFSASNPHKGEDKIQICSLYKQLETLLEGGGKIYIHCSAGIHRTGMITYGLLRYLGKEQNEALQFLRELREVTAVQAGKERLFWGDQFSDGKVFGQTVSNQFFGDTKPNIVS